MGNRSLKPGSGIPELSQWVSVGKEHYAEILKNPDTEEQIQKFVVGQIENQNLNTQVKVYFLRMNELPRSVRVLHYGYEKTGSICASPEYFVVVTERSKRLSDYGTLTLPEASLILEQALKGFALLFQLFGLFTITSNLIGITPKQEVKVWLNENFGLNTIDEDPSAAVSEKHQLENLVTIIKTKITDECSFDNFGAQLLAHSKFDEAVAFLDSTPRTTASLQATASFPANVSAETDSKAVIAEPQPVAPKPPVRITFQSPQKVLKSSNRNHNPVIREVVYPQIYQKEAAPRTTPHQKPLQFSHSYQNRLQSPSPSLSRVLIHYSPPIDLKRSVVVATSAVSKSPVSARLSEQYRIPLVDSELIVEKMNSSVSMNLSRLKMEGATILESRVISHP